MAVHCGLNKRHPRTIAINTKRSRPTLFEGAMANVSDFLSVKSIAEKNPDLTEGGLRWMLFNSGSNGLAASGAVVRVGGRVWIHEPKFCKWLESHAEAGSR